jgi:hypothetical protein
MLENEVTVGDEKEEIVFLGRRFLKKPDDVRTKDARALYLRSRFFFIRFLSRLRAFVTAIRFSYLIHTIENKHITIINVHT